MLKLVEIANCSDALTPDIRKACKEFGGALYTKKYVAFEDGNEVGYLVLDWWPLDQKADLILYGLFVSEQFRNRGVGERILMETEKLAKVGSYSRIVLTAGPMEGYPKHHLMAWYEKHGFKAISKDEMAKDVS
jgi:GNAT superfamily N-acetyltransferase